MKFDKGYWDEIEPNFKVEPGAIIYPDCIIGKDSIIGANAVLRPHTTIGEHTIFGTLSCSEGYNDIGDYCTIHAQCHITQGVHIGNNVFIAPFFIASNTPIITSGRHGTENTDYKKLDTFIEDEVRIGICVSFIPGITIGHNSVIYQNTLITKSIPPYSIVKAGKDQVGKIIGTTH